MNISFKPLSLSIVVTSLCIGIDAQCMLVKKNLKTKLITITQKYCSSEKANDKLAIFNTRPKTLKWQKKIIRKISKATALRLVKGHQAIEEADKKKEVVDDTAFNAQWMAYFKDGDILPKKNGDEVISDTNQALKDLPEAKPRKRRLLKDELRYPEGEPWYSDKLAWSMTASEFAKALPQLEEQHRDNKILSGDKE